MAKLIETVTCPVCSGFYGGTVTQLLVKVGDRIEVGTEVIEAEDELAFIPIPSSKAGMVVRIHLKQGDRVDWDAPILDIESDLTGASSTLD